jgi:hypothetical protein
MKLFRLNSMSIVTHRELIIMLREFRLDESHIFSLFFKMLLCYSKYLCETDLILTIVYLADVGPMLTGSPYIIKAHKTKCSISE